MPPITIADVIGFAAYDLAVSGRLDLPLIVESYRRAREGAYPAGPEWLPEAGGSEPAVRPPYDAKAVAAPARGAAAAIAANRSRHALQETRATVQPKEAVAAARGPGGRRTDPPRAGEERNFAGLPSSPSAPVSHSEGGPP
jgi:hypothetical protein